jgi:hypothetical protein
VPSVEGDPGVWRSVSRHNVGWLDDHATGATGYFVLSVNGSTAELSRLDWFDADSYEPGINP